MANEPYTILQPDRNHPMWTEALRLAVTSPDAGPRQADQNIRHLLESAAVQKMTLRPFCLVRNPQPIEASIIALRSPGRTAMLLIGLRSEEKPPEALKTLIETTARELAGEDVVLLQSLVAPEQIAIATSLRGTGFTYLAELVYMENPIRNQRPNRPSPHNLRHLAYSDALHGQFVSAVDLTYRESLDCPGLSGTRDPHDVVLGHRHTGDCDPVRDWHLALIDNEPAGVLLLSRVCGRPLTEVVYLGVAPAARGKGVGDALLSLAFDVARKSKSRAITLAVDRANTFARDLYARWEFSPIASRRAWIRRMPL